MKKLLSIFKYVLLAISALTILSIFFLGEDGGTNVMLVWTYILLGLTLAAALVFPLINLVQNPKAAMRSLIGLGVMIVVLAVSYAMSNTDPVVNSAGGFFTDPSELIVTDMGLYTTYIALGAAILAVVFGEVRNSIK